MFRLFFISTLIVLFSVFSAFGADADNEGTYQVNVLPGGVLYTITVAYGATDSTDDLHTKAIPLWYADPINKPIVVQAWGNAATNIDVNVDCEFSNELNDTQFIASVLDFDALGAAAAVMHVFNPGGNAAFDSRTDSTALNLYMRFECDGQTANPQTAEIYFKVWVPAKDGIREQDLRGKVNVVSTS